MKRKKSLIQPQLSNKIILALGMVLLVAVLIFFGYRLYQENQESAYFIKVEEVQKEANEKIYKLNQKFALFQSDPRIARQVLPQFKKAQQALEKSRGQLKEIKPIPKAKFYHQKLLLLYANSASLSGDLASLAEYLKTREKLFINLGKAVEAFGKRVKKAESNQKVIDEATSLRKKCDDTLNKLRKLAPALKIYTSSLFRKYLEELSQSLKELETGLTQKDAGKVETAVAKLNEVLSRDWSKAFLETDVAGINNYQARLKKINTLQAEIKNIEN